MLFGGNATLDYLLFERESCNVQQSWLSAHVGQGRGNRALKAKLNLCLSERLLIRKKG